MSLDVETLNFHHLRYFWLVVQEGGVLAASRRLKVSHATVSAQLRDLEAWLGVSLFDRRGRSLELTEAGQAAFDHADKIFRIGRELLNEVPTGIYRRSFRVGVTDELPKLLTRRLLTPFFEDEGGGVRLYVDEERHRSLLARLAVRDLDVVLSDAPTPSAFRMEVSDYELGRSEVRVLAAPNLAARLKPDFPSSLDGAPWIGPTRESSLGRRVASWMNERDIAPELVVEVADSALAKTLGSDGLGAFALPQAAVIQACKRYGLEVVGPLPGVEMQFYLTVSGQGPPRRDIQRLIDQGERIFAEIET